ncbi:MAG: hypothetical protein HKN47_29000, partial [Pirellulaceae bacterium]|nr:hypothetical protein [Pirellulaceae bacterium]
MRFALLLSCLCWLANCHATEPTGAAKGHSPAPDPIAFWTFDQIPEGDPTGQVKIVTSELTSPSFPDFPESNSVLSLAAPSYVQIPSVDDDRFDFDNGDWITVESWVNPRSLAENAYIVSKGRTGTSGRTSIDQNWAVRLRKRSGEACLNFLFRSQDNDSTPGDWHRWTSTNGFGIDSGWHHIAVSYQFGNPKSIIGFVDGRPVKGTWDMGGATEQPPIQSESRVWIGSAMNGNRGNSFDGQIDQLAIYRTNVPEQFLQSRYNYKPQPIQRPEIPPQKILVQLLGPISAIGEIPARLNQTPRKQWTQDAMAFTRLPFNYDSWGVRDDWTQGDAKSMVVRAWANVHLEPGDYQIMVRSRSFSRLLIDGQAIVTTPKQVNRGGAHHVVDPLPNVPVDGMRPHFMSDHERIVSFHSDGGTQEWMYEAIVGGPNYRLEFGETSVAIARTDEMFHLVSDRHTFPLTDDGWNQFSQRQRAMLDQLDRRTRQKLASQQSQYWNQRHTYAKEHLISDQQHTDIDSIIQSRIDAENTRRSNTEHAGQADTLYTDRVQPILRRHCARCHDDKQQGELRIFDRKNLLSGGESGDAAIIPGDPDAGYLIELITAEPDEYRMPPKGDGLTKEEVATVKKWIADGATMP